MSAADEVVSETTTTVTTVTTTKTVRSRFRLSGLVQAGDEHHWYLPGPSSADDKEIHAMLSSPRAKWGFPDGVPFYAEAKRSPVVGFCPGTDCDGYFMSNKFQPNNNCYAYACNIASNSYPQPGRYSDTAPIRDITTAVIQPVETIVQGAIADGLVYLGQEGKAPDGPGHRVALMYSPSDKAIGSDKKAVWCGDFHWCREDGPGSWSQKNGTEQVTDFDFAGNKITDPRLANWTSNQGPLKQLPPGAAGRDKAMMVEYTVKYTFECFFWVPYDKEIRIL